LNSIRKSERRTEVLSALGGKFDTMAKMDRVAEDDQAQISHDEFRQMDRELAAFHA
jgi:hypothetical protein